jgi:hypothetical protein
MQKEEKYSASPYKFCEKDFQKEKRAISSNDDAARFSHPVSAAAPESALSDMTTYNAFFFSFCDCIFP